MIRFVIDLNILSYHRNSMECPLMRRYKVEKIFEANESQKKYQIGLHPSFPAETNIVLRQTEWFSKSVKIGNRYLVEKKNLLIFSPNSNRPNSMKKKNRFPRIIYIVKLYLILT